MELARGACAGCGSEVWVRDLYTDEAPGPPTGLCEPCRPKEAYEPWRRKGVPSVDQLAQAVAVAQAMGQWRIATPALDAILGPRDANGRRRG